MNKINLGIVVPCFNEEEVIAETADKLMELIVNLVDIGLIADNSSIYFVDDGSSDDTWNLIEKLAKDNKLFNGIKLSANKGHQNALLCGLMMAQGDALISLDADLQDDVEIIPKMVKLCYEGNDIVYAVRGDRSSDSFFKKNTAEFFYYLMKKFGVDVVFNHADYRLMSRRVVTSLSEYKEANLFLRGIVRLLGYKYEIVQYIRKERFAGESKYPLNKMLSFALDGITSFSIVPLRFIFVCGFIILIINFILIAWSLISYLIGDAIMPGWTSTVLPIYFLGGLQMIFMGIMGEYIGKIYLETKGRPRYHVDKLTGDAFSGADYPIKSR